MTLLYGDPTLFGPRAVIGATSGEIGVRLLPKDHADRIIRQGHYSGCVVWSSNLHLGVYADGECIGAMQFGPAMNPASGGKVVEGATQETWLELNRLWLDDDKPINTGTRAIACAISVIRNTRPAVTWIQSFADERCGKLGGIYQAASFLYCGSHTAIFYEIDGVFVHKSMLDRPAMDKRGWRSGPKVAWAKANADRAVEHTFRQFRYFKPLRTAARRNLLLDVLPYPKPASIAAE